MARVNMSGRDSSGTPQRQGKCDRARSIADSPRPPKERYTYTTAGDLNADQNKGITSTTYNVLGKPRQITFNNNRRVDYFYDAAGNKTRVVVFQKS